MMKFSPLARYYFIYLIELIIVWGILNLVNLDFFLIIFFMVGFVWPLTLVTPNLKNKVQISRGRFSFLSVVFKLNQYLQMLINKKNIWFISSLVRLISPMLFITIVNILGGNANYIPVLGGWLIFEISHYFLKRFYTEKESSPLDDIINP